MKRLFAVSSNLCAFPKCRAPLVLEGTLIGEICHIRGLRPDSARYDSSQTDVERNQYDNLILLCPNHHTVVDDDEASYSVQRLLALKAAHELSAAKISEEETSRMADLAVHSIGVIGQGSGLTAHTVNASSITFQSGAPGEHFARQRQIQAVENLWQIVCNFRSEFGSLILADTILTSEEIDSFFQTGNLNQIGDMVSEYANRDAAFQKLRKSGSNEADKERPFVSSRLWTIFFVLQAVHARSALLLTNSFKDKRFRSWKDDSVCSQHLHAVLPESKVAHAKAMEIGGLRVLIGLLEGQFLAEAGMSQTHK